MASKRKSLKSIEGSFNNESLASVNDDEAERSRYRKQLAEQVQSSPLARSTSSTASATAAPSPSILETFTAKQLNDHFTSCIKLNAENKINVKNAFDLQLIDYMTLMLKKKDSCMNDFSIASTTLDASAKIYGCRVDSLFQKVVSIANTLATSKGKEGAGGDNEEEEGGDGEQGPEGTKKKKKRNRPKKTVLPPHSLHTINRKVIEKGPWNKFLIDYADSSMLLSSSLHHATLGITMSNDDKLFPSPGESYQSQGQIIKAPLPELPNGSELCPTFAKFSWDISTSATDFSLENDIEHAFDINQEPEPVPELEYDDPFDGGGGGVEFDEEASEIVGVEKLENAARGVTAAKITEVTNMLSVESNHEYSYFDEKLLDLWAGPSHWKLRKSTSERTRNSSDEAQRARAEKLKLKKQFKIEYNPNLKISNKFGSPPDRTSNCLSTKTVAAWSTRKITYSEDCHANPADLLKFFLHKRLSFDFKALLRNSKLFDGTAPIPCTSNDQVNENLDPENVNLDERPPSPNCPIEDDLPDDVDDGAPDDYYVDDFGGDEEGVIGEEEMGGTGNTLDMNEYTTGAFIGENLLPIPNIVNKVDLQIDTRRKVINMKLLKKMAWKIMNFDKCRTQLNMDNPGCTSTDKEAPSIKFADLYRHLLKDIPANMQQDLTAPVTFFTVLILVNEKSLSLSGETTEDLVIHASKGNSAQRKSLSTA